MKEAQIDRHDGLVVGDRRDGADGQESRKHLCGSQHLGADDELVEAAPEANSRWRGATADADAERVGERNEAIELAIPADGVAPGQRLGDAIDVDGECGSAARIGPAVGEDKMVRAVVKDRCGGDSDAGIRAILIAQKEPDVGTVIGG